MIYGDILTHLGQMFHELAGYRERQIEEGPLMLYGTCEPVVLMLRQAYSGKPPQDENADTNHSYGTAHSNEEAPVMGEE
jgi:hypothetical protein